jgi:hemoglobin-like flavoprotein
MCPSDILIQASGLPRLSAFDFSNLLRENARMSGNFLVDRESLAYMTPEWFFGNKEDKFTDQYSLGIIATELLGGTPIPRVKNPCDLEHKRSLFTELESGKKGDWTKRSPPFKGLVCKMLSTDPSNRWSSMSEVRERLQILEVAESPGERHRTLAMNSYLSLQGGGTTGELFTRFYENLFSVLPEIKPHFQSISMEDQHHKLNRAIDKLLQFCPDAEPDLLQLVPRHAKLQLTRHHYDVFRDTLVKTIEELGENDPEILTAWRSALRPGIDFLWDCQEKHQSR